MTRFVTLLALGLVLALPASAQVTVYSSDFEANNGGWAGTGDWEHGAVAAVPDRTGCFSQTGPFPTAGHSGTNAWATNLDGCHAHSTTSNLTRTFNLTGVSGNVQFCWWQFIDSGGNTFDMATLRVNGVQLRLDDGSSANAYEEVCMDFNAYAGQAAVAVDFQFVTTASVSRAGWYIDDVRLTANTVVATEGAPSDRALNVRAFPNPFAGATQLELTLAQTEHVRVEVYNALGQRVALVADGPLTAGRQLLTLEAAGLAPGAYLVRVTGETFLEAVRVTLHD